MAQSLIGTVEWSGGYYKIISPDAPAHLQVLFLTARQMGGAKVGDRVRLEYHVTPHSGLWNVAAVLSNVAAVLPSEADEQARVAETRAYGRAESHMRARPDDEPEGNPDEPYDVVEPDPRDLAEDYPGQRIDGPDVRPCPQCGGPLDFDPACVIDEPFYPPYPLRDQPLPRRTRTAPAVLCARCEYCAEVQR